MKILLVEDNETIGQYYEESIQELGHTVIWSKTAKINVPNIDAAIVDIFIDNDKIGGAHLIKKLQRKNIPHVGITNFPKSFVSNQVNIKILLNKMSSTPSQIVDMLHSIINHNNHDLKTNRAI